MFHLGRVVWFLGLIGHVSADAASEVCVDQGSGFTKATEIPEVHARLQSGRPPAACVLHANCHGAPALEQCVL